MSLLANLRRREIPMTVAVVLSVLIILNTYFKPAELTAATSELLYWYRVLFCMTLGIGVINMLIVHGRNVTQRRKGFWPFSLMVLVLGAICWISTVQSWPKIDNWFTSPLYVWFVMPAESTVYSLQFVLYIWIIYQRFRVSNIETALFAGSTVVCLFSSLSLGIAIAPSLYPVGAWIYDWPTPAFSRAMLLSIGLGELAFFVRTLRGLESGYLGVRE